MSVLGLDTEQVLAQARRRIARAPIQLAEGFARFVRQAPPSRLEQLMSSPVRRPLLEAIFWQMPQHMSRRSAGSLEATIDWRITGRADGGADAFRLTISDGRCRVSRGSAHEPARLKITLDGVEFLKLVTGNVDPTQAYFGGDIALAGDIMLAAKMQMLFRIPSARP